MNIEQFSASILPPDSLHGNATLEQLYATYSEEWVENAAFIVETENGVAWAAFNDYFLSVGEGVCPAVWERRSIVHLSIGNRKSTIDGAINVHVSRERYSELEEGALGVWREGSASSAEDVLSLVCLCATLGISELH